MGLTIIGIVAGAAAVIIASGGTATPAVVAGMKITADVAIATSSTLGVIDAGIDMLQNDVNLDNVSDALGAGAGLIPVVGPITKIPGGKELTSLAISAGVDKGIEASTEHVDNIDPTSIPSKHGNYNSPAPPSAEVNTRNTDQQKVDIKQDELPKCRVGGC